MHHHLPRPRRGAAMRPALTGALVAALTAATAAPAAVAAPPQVVDTTTRSAPPAAFDRLAAQAEGEQDGRTRVIVTLKARFDRTDATSKATAPGLEHRMHRVHAKALEALAGTDHGDTNTLDGLPYVALDASEEAIRALEESGHVAAIQRDRVLQPQLAETTQLIESVPQVARDWDGSGGTVAVVDSGITMDHPFFAGRIVAPACFSTLSNCPNGQTVQFGPDSAWDDAGHGTHVAGIAAGRRFADVTFDGVAPDAKIMPIRIHGAWGALQSDLIASLSYVREQALAGVDVASVNVSQGDGRYVDSGTCDADPLKVEIDNLRDLGIPTVVASGNDGYTDAVLYPACISSAITVGATRETDVVAAFSDASPGIDLLAPGEGKVEGEGILSSWTTGGFWGGRGTRGTSMAAPHVAGAWATYLERYPGSSVDEVLAAFQRTGKPILDTRNGSNLTRSRINLSAALSRSGHVIANSPTSSSYTPTGQGNSMGATNTVTRSATGSYVVQMPKLGNGFHGNAHAQASGNTTNRCKVSSLGATGTTTRIGVRCTTIAGALADTQFVARFEVNETKRPNNAGYLTSLDPTSAAHTPEPTFQANSTGATNTVSRSGVGRYSAAFPGFTSLGVPHVTALGADTKTCQISQPGTGTVFVACYTQSGIPSDSAFSLTANHQSTFTTGRGASMYANNPAAITAYTPSVSWNSTGAVNTAKKVTTGVYDVRMPGIATASSVPTVTAVNSTTAVSCRPSSWVDGIVAVRCTTAAGTAIDTPFTVSYSSTAS